MGSGNQVCAAVSWHHSIIGTLTHIDLSYRRQHVLCKLYQFDVRKVLIGSSGLTNKDRYGCTGSEDVMIGDRVS